jgi:hypothetical protein
MKERRHKIHYSQDTRDIGICGLDGLITYTPNGMTCRICMFRYLAMQSPWARGFLDELRGRGQAPAVIVPTGLAEEMDGVKERSRSALGRTFRPERVSQKAISELFPEFAPVIATVQPVMNDGWPPAKAVGVQPREVAQCAGDGCKVCDEPGGHG